jgi:hypothetical protein
MAQDWHALTALTGGRTIEIERVRLVHEDVAVEGRFALPPLAQLEAEDQVFVAAFVRSHGSIKQMERLFGVSYPTIKNRLNRIGDRLPSVEVAPAAPPRLAPYLETTVAEVLARLEADRVAAAGDKDDRHE